MIASHTGDSSRKLQLEAERSEDKAVVAQSSSTRCGEIGILRRDRILGRKNKINAHAVPLIDVKYLRMKKRRLTNVKPVRSANTT